MRDTGLAAQLPANPVDRRKRGARAESRITQAGADARALIGEPLIND
jgi:hypothetical protein